MIMFLLSSKITNIIPVRGTLLLKPLPIPLTLKKMNSLTGLRVSFLNKQKATQICAAFCHF